IVERAVKKRNLQALRSFAGQGDPTGIILASLGATRDGKEPTSGPNNIMILSYRGPVPDECAEILNAVIESYKNFLDEAYNNVSEENLRLITAHRDFLKKDLEEARRQHRQFRDRHDPLIFTGSDGVNTSRKRVIDLEEELTKLTARRTKLQGELDNIDAAMRWWKGLSRDQVLAVVLPPTPEGQKGHAEYQGVRDKLMLLRLEEAKWRANGYGDGFPELKAVLNQIALGERLLA